MQHKHTADPHTPAWWELWGAAVFITVLLAGSLFCQTLIWRFILLPKANAQTGGVQVFHFAQQFMRGKSVGRMLVPQSYFRWDRPHSSALGAGVLRLDRARTLRLILECDDFGNLSIDGRKLIDQKGGVSANNRSEVEVRLSEGPHLLLMEMNNRPGAGWIRLEASLGPGGKPVLLGREQGLSPITLSNLPDWWKAREYIRAGFISGLLLFLIALGIHHRRWGPLARSYARVGRAWQWTLGQEYCRWSLIYFGLALLNLRVKIQITSGWTSGLLHNNHARLLEFMHTNNEQSRLLQYYIPELFVQIFGIDLRDAYTLQRLIFTFAAFSCFHIYLRRWFDQKTAALGVVFLAAVMPYTYMDHLQESAPLLMLTFLLGLWAIRERRAGWYVLVLFVGAFNNETMLILPSVYFFYNFQSWRPGSLVPLSLRTVLYSLPAFAATIVIRYITRHAPHAGEPFRLFINLEGFGLHLHYLPLEYYKAYYINLVFVWGLMWVLPYVGFRRKPLFLRRASLMVPLFLFCHFLTGIIFEVRQMIPLAYILIPMSLYWLIPSLQSERNRRAAD